MLYRGLAWISAACLLSFNAYAEPQAYIDRRTPVVQSKPYNTPVPPANLNEKRVSYSNSWRDFSTPARFALTGGYREDNLKWNIAADPSGTQTPNILSELSWKNIRSYEFHGEGEYRVPEGMLEGLYFNADGYYGNIFDGKNQDSDYETDNRTGEFSRSNNQADEGSVQGLSGGLGYAFQWNNIQPVQVLRLIGMGGYAYNEQRLQMTDGNQTVSGCAFSICAPSIGPFSGLDSRYNARWTGPYLGLDLASRFATNHAIRLRGRYFWADYYGRARWNLRSDFNQDPSFEHKADGNGYMFNVAYAYAFNDSADITLEGQYEYFSTDPGRDITYLSNGTVAATRLNKVEWDAKTVRLGIDYRF